MKLSRRALLQFGGFTLAGAMLGAGIAFLAASRKDDADNEGYDEADLFV